ncbi:hypothetical protein HZS_3621 [Henneguya salminicola]|nr:hypothetical protein HZS_3621 [Henneguya salminicola]
MSTNDYINSFLTEKFSQLSLSSSQIFQGLILSLRGRLVHMLNTVPSNSMIYSTIRNNRELIGMNPIKAVISCNLSMLLSRRHPWAKEKHRILILIRNEYNSHNFINGAFKITPHPFFQYVIVMRYDCGTELYAHAPSH